MFWTPSADKKINDNNNGSNKNYFIIHILDLYVIVLEKMEECIGEFLLACHYKIVDDHLFMTLPWIVPEDGCGKSLLVLLACGMCHGVLVAISTSLIFQVRDRRILVLPW